MHVLRIHGPAFRRSQKTEKEKKEIQAWMKRKQKERLADYLNKRDEQREKEHMPFNVKNCMVRLLCIWKNHFCINIHKFIK